jgi:L-asparaginase/Glu-tRNA(Gln) amidotransferase subunit D
MTSEKQKILVINTGGTIDSEPYSEKPAVVKVNEQSLVSHEVSRVAGDKKQFPFGFDITMLTGQNAQTAKIFRMMMLINWPIISME